MDCLLLSASLFINVLSCQILRIAYCRKHVKNAADLHLFNAFSSVVTAAGLAAFCAIGVMQKLHQTSRYKEELGAFLVAAFISSALLSFLLTLYHGKKECRRPSACGGGASAAPLALYSIACGAGIAFCNHCNTYLSGVIDSVILFPVLYGGCMILTTAAGLILWKERLTRTQTVGMILGFAGILLLCGADALWIRLFG
jgi:drug/metabolite transporter (DMT)-like permease